MFAINTITPAELMERQKNNDEIQLVDVRDDHERKTSSIGGVHIPFSELQTRYSEISTDKPVVLYCHYGERSFFAVQMLQMSMGFSNLLNLKSGINGWSLDVDPAIPKY